MARSILRLKTRLGLTFAAVSLFTAAFLLFFLFLSARTQMREDTRQRLEDAVAIGALQLDGDAHSTLVAREQEASDTYGALKLVLQRIRDAGTDIRFVYTMRAGRGGEVVFVVDAETSEADVSHLGDAYGDASPTLKARIADLDAPLVEERYYTDRWGTWLTGYAPFYRSDGRREGVLAMDIAASKVEAREREFLGMMMITLAVVVVIVILLGLALGRRIAAPITRLKAGAERITGGDIEHEVEVTGDDELGELATAFNSMTRQLRRSLQSLKAEVDERIAAERTLKIGEELYRTLYEDNPSMYFTVGQDGVALSVNEFGAAQLGYAVEELRGRPMAETYHDDDRAAFAGQLGRCLAAPSQVTRWELRKIKKDGTVIWVKETGRAVRRGDESMVVLVVCEDITEKRLMEEEVLQSAKLASVGRLAAGVAHEINNPLSAITQSAQVLGRALQTDHPRTRAMLEDAGISPVALEAYLQKRKVPLFAEAIVESVRRAALIVSSLLDFSRVSRDEATPLDFNALLSHTIDLAAADYDLRKKYDFKKIRLSWMLDPDLPLVTCHGQQIQQVVLNLVRNAAQAMAQHLPGSAPSRPEPRLTLRTQALVRGVASDSGGRWVRLEIEDNGPGIPEEVRPRLFDPFFTTKGHEGTGLGLWLCWSIIVERHKGRLWMEPSRDGGSRLLVELPARFADGKDPGPAAT